MKEVIIIFNKPVISTVLKISILVFIHKLYRDISALCESSKNKYAGFIFLNSHTAYKLNLYKCQTAYVTGCVEHFNDTSLNRRGKRKNLLIIFLLHIMCIFLF